jgi:hypothetical protein
MATLRKYVHYALHPLERGRQASQRIYVWCISCFNIKKLIACYVVSIPSLEVENIITKLRICIMYWKFCLHPLCLKNSFRFAGKHKGNWFFQLALVGLTCIVGILLHLGFIYQPYCNLSQVQFRGWLILYICLLLYSYAMS